MTFALDSGVVMWGSDSDVLWCNAWSHLALSSSVAQFVGVYITRSHVIATAKVKNMIYDVLIESLPQVVTFLAAWLSVDLSKKNHLSLTEHKLL